MATSAKPPIDSRVVVLEQRNELGNVDTRTEMKDGVLHGQMTRFGPAGKPVMQATYAAGVLQGISRVWDDTGILVQEATYRDGKPNGLMRVYAGGRILSEQMFANGVAHGPATYYSEAGDPNCKMSFVLGQIEGEALFMNEGAVVRRAAYRKGLLEGEAIDYDREGTKVQSGTYKANLLDGWLRRYWPNGKVMEETQYKQGKPVGRPKRYDSKGAKQSEEASQDGLMQRLERLVRG